MHSFNTSFNFPARYHVIKIAGACTIDDIFRRNSSTNSLLFEIL